MKLRLFNSWTTCLHIMREHPHQTLQNKVCIKQFTFCIPEQNLLSSAIKGHENTKDPFLVLTYLPLVFYSYISISHKYTPEILDSMKQVQIKHVMFQSKSQTEIHRTVSLDNSTLPILFRLLFMYTDNLTYVYEMYDI